MNYRLLVFDVDGVVTEGETRALDLTFLDRLAKINRAARQDSSLPAITLCTGRPAPYVEAILQAMDGRTPAIFENGAGIYVPDGYHFLSHPELDSHSPVQAVRDRLNETVVRDQIAFIQPGKEYTFSLFAFDPAETEHLHEHAGQALGDLSEAVEMVYSASCLNIMPRGIDKGKGLSYLAELTGYRPQEMVGVGDSDIDLSFLDLVGFSAAPSNANERVKRLVDYVSSQSTSAGVTEILGHLGIWDRGSGSKE